MSPCRSGNESSGASAFDVHGSVLPGHLTNWGIKHTEGVVRSRNFSLIKFFHNICYSRKNYRETNIIQSV